MHIHTQHDSPTDMIDDSAGRLKLFKYVRSMPLSPSECDLITGLASEFSSPVIFPPLSEIVQVFGNVGQSHIPVIEAMAICATAASDLAITLCSQSLNAHRTDQIKTGIQIYVSEIFRLAGSVFHPQHAYWKTLYRHAAPMRQTNWTASALDSNADAAVAQTLTRTKFGLFLLPLEATYILSGEKNALTYEMLCHSLSAVFSAILLRAVCADPVIISGQLALAGKLSARLDLIGYDAWLVLMHQQIKLNY